MIYFWKLSCGAALAIIAALGHIAPAIDVGNLPKACAWAMRSFLAFSSIRSSVALSTIYKKCVSLLGLDMDVSSFCRHLQVE